jgi:hypothetical protein
MTTTCNDITSPKNAVSLSQRDKENDKPTLNDQTPSEPSQTERKHTEILPATSVTGPLADITTLDDGQKGQHSAGKVAPSRGFNDEPPPNPSMISKNHAQILQSPSVTRPLTDITSLHDVTDETPPKMTIAPKDHTQTGQSMTAIGPPTLLISKDAEALNTGTAPTNQAQSLESPGAYRPPSDITEDNILEKLNQRIRFNLSQPERPSVYTKRLIISMDPARFEAFKAISQQTGRSMARLMRGAIDTLVEMYQEASEHKALRPVEVTSIPINIGETTKRSEVNQR